MDTEALARLVPTFMVEHPGHSWTLLSDGESGSDLRLEIRPLADPTRVASVVVFTGAEVYSSTFAGHTAVDFAYEDGDKPEALHGRIDFAAAALTGPTRVTLESDGETVVRSTIVINPDSSMAQTFGPVDRPFRRLRARIRRRRIVEEVLDFPALPHG